MCLFLGVASALMALLAHGFFRSSLQLPPPSSRFPSLFYGLLPIVLLTASPQLHCDSQHLDRFALPLWRGSHLHLDPRRRVAPRSRFGIWPWSMHPGRFAAARVIVAGMMEATAILSAALAWMTDATREVAGQYGPVLLSSVVASGGCLSISPWPHAARRQRLRSGLRNRFVSVVLTLLAGAVSTASCPTFRA